ncbi:Di-copper centre-containing protein [Wallemia mellicola]|uniref:Di-copper centre-containing protein n=1 Tax=Wallemia mellicola TaxID=1708541 RepID=A0A4T0QUJ8_9BASI|nr:Di-copper centre-containing protein [Wallemia mellicola]TIB82258.1 Di-copper centre-containing protein [Wallemia mellicola]TIB84992.1 Di-copper centre-containing protein [Wallemia mellicola]TIC09177.1 Di-copper centre-containing protein [Wallemia mellicola]TIC24238.1 Di-copper centre-containing protein [Wallemia mellicola]
MKLSLLALAAAGFAAALPTTLNEGYSEECPNGLAIRPEWSQMSKKHRKEYISALQCMINKPSTVNETQINSHYEDFWYTHQFPGPAIHFVAAFLPWHRHYVYTYHQSLKECGYTGEMPFWAWDWNADDVFKSSIFDPDSESGLGTNGTTPEGAPINGFAVTDGGLANHQIEYPYKHSFQRNFNLKPPGTPVSLDTFIKESEVTKALAYDRYDYFHKYVEGAPPQEIAKGVPEIEGMKGFAGMHGAVHRLIGGDMASIIDHKAPDWCPSFESDESSNYGANASPNDPLFFVHHSNIDRIWAKWQDQDPENNKFAYGGFTFHNYTTEEGTGVASINDTLEFGFITDPVPVHYTMDYQKTYCYKYADKDYREEDNLVDFLAQGFSW